MISAIYLNSIIWLTRSIKLNSFEFYRIAAISNCKWQRLSIQDTLSWICQTLITHNCQILLILDHEITCDRFIANFDTRIILTIVYCVLQRLPCVLLWIASSNCINTVHIIYEIPTRLGLYNFFLLYSCILNFRVAHTQIDQFGISDACVLHHNLWNLVFCICNFIEIYIGDFRIVHAICCQIFWIYKIPFWICIYLW
jgi:hypothetical protein